MVSEEILLNSVAVFVLLARDIALLHSSSSSGACKV